VYFFFYTKLQTGPGVRFLGFFFFFFCFFWFWPIAFIKKTRRGSFSKLGNPQWYTGIFWNWKGFVQVDKMCQRINHGIDVNEIGDVDTVNRNRQLAIKEVLFPEELEPWAHTACASDIVAKTIVRPNSNSIREIDNSIQPLSGRQLA
jgi:hypothetical protein